MLGKMTKDEQTASTLFGGWSLLLSVLIDAEPLDLRLQRLAWNAELCCRAGRARDTQLTRTKALLARFDLRCSAR